MGNKKKVAGRNWAMLGQWQGQESWEMKGWVEGKGRHIQGRRHNGIPGKVGKGQSTGQMEGSKAGQQ